MKSECSTSSCNHSAFVSLNSRQLERLRSVLSQEVQVHGRENFPTLEVPLHTFIVNVRRKLLEAEIPLKHVKLNGGAACFVFANSDFMYSDVDLIFSLSLSDDQDFDRVRQAVFDALLEMLPSSTNKDLISVDTLKEVYIRKMVKVADGDRWSLFSLHNNYGRCIELKFVDQMRRQFEFSVDSFQITLDPLIDNLNGEKHPIIKAESMYGDFLQALHHLNRQLIDTRNPEEIRGGGLLKYCHLLTKEYYATQNCREMEKYMCSRFFIDFPDVQIQEMKLHCYLQNHFGNEDQLKLDYLQMLYHVIKESTICLMSHERRQTLTMVDRLRHHLSFNHHQQQMYYVPTANGGFIPTVQYQPPPYRPKGRRHYHDRHQHYSGGHQQWHNKQRAISPATSVVTTTTSGTEDEGASQQQQQVLVIQQQQQDPQQQQQQVYVPRQTLLYLPPNATHWIPVV